jgi:ABC-type antimicrobial peptide transport system permease subunit
MLTLSAGLAGLSLAKLLSLGMAFAFKDVMPGFAISGGTFLFATALMVAFGLVAGLWPSVMALRLKVVDALRRA